MRKWDLDGMDLANFSVVAVWPQDADHAAILMRGKREETAKWCIQYKGNGHYFQTVTEAFDYCEKRKFKIRMEI